MQIHDNGGLFLLLVQTIKPADIATVRKLGKPPHLIMRIMDCVLILMRRRLNNLELDAERPCPKPSWNEALKLMNQSQFLGMLLNFPKVFNLLLMLICYLSTCLMAKSLVRLTCFA